ncbi:hypothetical protein K4F52_009612 [Lecanicillium sp. MT-2017a]|nr:hypothetical protein K4F52_009612 [Lecanicillium sp. MT-2017a]
MTTPKYFLIIGATGRQGSTVVNALLSHPTFHIHPSNVYAVTRDANGSGASRLRSEYKGINIVAGNLENPSEIFAQLDPKLASQTGAYMAQAHGPTELEEGKNFITAAAEHGISYFVYSSVDRGGRDLSDKDPSYCKTFSDKFYIEKHLLEVAESSSMDYTILRPTWFADNAWWGFPGKLCMTGWRENMAGKRLQVTVTCGIGRWAAETFLDADKRGIRNQALSIASDELTFQEIDDIFMTHTGHGVPATYGFLARFIIWMVKDLSTMFGFIGERQYGANLDWLKTQIKPTTFKEWVEMDVPRS